MDCKTNKLQINNINRTNEIVFLKPQPPSQPGSGCPSLGSSAAPQRWLRGQPSTHHLKTQVLVVSKPL